MKRITKVGLVSLFILMLSFTIGFSAPLWENGKMFVMSEHDFTFIITARDANDDEISSTTTLHSAGAKFVYFKAHPDGHSYMFIIYNTDKSITDSISFVLGPNMMSIVSQSGHIIFTIDKNLGLFLLSDDE